MAEAREDSGSARASGITEPQDKPHWLGGESVLDNGDANRESQIHDSDATKSHSVPNPQQLREEVSLLRTFHHDTLRRLNCHSGQLVDLERALICEQAKQKGREQLAEFFTLCTTGSESEHQAIIDSLRKIEKFGDNRCAKLDERIADVEGLEKRTKRMFQRMNDQNLWYKTLVTELNDCKREIAVLRKHQEDTAGTVAQTKSNISKLQQCVQELFEAPKSTAQTEDSIRKLQQCVQELSEAQTKLQKAESVKAEYTPPRQSVSHSGEASEPRDTGGKKDRSLNGSISVGLQGQPENEVTPAAFQKLSRQVTDL